MDSRFEDFLSKAGISADATVRNWIGERLEKLPSEQFNQLEKLVQQCATLWAQQQHQHFTKHGLEHSAHIVERLSQWLMENQTNLNNSEFFLLFGSAYLHDVGMQCNSHELLQAQGIELNAENHAVADINHLEAIRKKHAALSEAMIRDACLPQASRKYAQCPLDCTAFPREAQLMASICRRHVGPLRDVPEELRNGNKDRMVEPNARVMLLIHLLRIGDALDADYRRLNPVYLNQRDFTSLPLIVRYHMYKHFSVSSVELKGGGTFVYHYALPAEAVDAFDGIRTAAEEHMHKHQGDSSEFLNLHKISFQSINSELIEEDAVPTCPFDDELRQEFVGAKVVEVFPKIKPGDAHFEGLVRVLVADLEVLPELWDGLQELSGYQGEISAESLSQVMKDVELTNFLIWAVEWIERSSLEQPDAVKRVVLSLVALYMDGERVDGAKDAVEQGILDVNYCIDEHVLYALMTAIYGKAIDWSKRQLSLSGKISPSNPLNFDSELKISLLALKNAAAEWKRLPVEELDRKFREMLKADKLMKKPWHLTLPEESALFETLGEEPEVKRWKELLLLVRRTQEAPDLFGEEGVVDRMLSEIMKQIDEMAKGCVLEA